MYNTDREFVNLSTELFELNIALDALAAKNGLYKSNVVKLTK